MLTLVAISLDRFYVIFYPLKPKLRIRHCLIIIGFIWLGSIILSSYQFFNYNVNRITITGEDNVSESSQKSTIHSNSSIIIYQCENNDRNYSVYHHATLFVIQYLLPFLILWFTFFAIGYKIYFRVDQKKFLSTHTNNNKNRKKVIKMILIVLFCFIICWTPLQLYNLLSIITPSINK